ncbi:MAG: hypothetical protein M1823_002653 [Watsoniomyces obsoletus]|nr:MAG: hypothetical protein M1823_002653 [Watsoniomyces obsoletus]
MRLNVDQLPPEPPLTAAEPGHDAQRDLVDQTARPENAPEETYGLSMWFTQGTGQPLSSVPTRPLILPFPPPFAFGQSLSGMVPDMSSRTANNLRSLRNNHPSVENNYSVDEDATPIPRPGEIVNKRKVTGGLFQPRNDLGKPTYGRTNSSRRLPEKRSRPFEPFDLSQNDVSGPASKRPRQTTPANFVDLDEVNSNPDSQVGQHAKPDPRPLSQSRSSPGTTATPWSSGTSQVRSGVAHSPRHPNGNLTTIREYKTVDSLVQPPTTRNRAGKPNKPAKTQMQAPLRVRVPRTPPSQITPAYPTEPVVVSDDESTGKQDPGAQQKATFILKSPLGRDGQKTGSKALPTKETLPGRRAEAPGFPGQPGKQFTPDAPPGPMKSGRRDEDSTKSRFFTDRAPETKQPATTQSGDIVFNTSRPKAAMGATRQRQALADMSSPSKAKTAIPAKPTVQPQTPKSPRDDSESDDIEMVPTQQSRATRSSTKKQTEGASRARLEQAYQSNSVSKKGDITATQLTSGGRSRPVKRSTRDARGESGGAPLPFVSFGIKRSQKNFGAWKLEDWEEAFVIIHAGANALRVRLDANDDPDDDHFIVSLPGIHKVSYANGTGCEAVLQLRSSEVALGPIWIRFRSHAYVEMLLEVLLPLGITSDGRTDDYMRSWCGRLDAELQEAIQKRKEEKRLLQAAKPANVDRGRTLVAARQKRALEEPIEVSDRTRRRRTEDARDEKAPEQLQMVPRKETPIARRPSPIPMRRSTRSQKTALQIASSAQEDMLDHRRKSPSPPPLKYSKLHGLPDRWSTAVVYPFEGARKTSVEWVDLEKLDEGEFLNDNIISFYLRYLEHQLEQTNPEQLKRIYTFNTFFYERLTSNGRRAKTVNYDAVSKWTSKVDIFSLDFIIVPINESAHWYLAVVCNLPQLLKDPVSEETDNIKIDEEAPPSVVSEIGTEDTSQLSPPPSSDDMEILEQLNLARTVEETGQTVANLSLSDEEEANADLQPTPSDVALPSVDALFDRRNGRAEDAYTTRTSSRTSRNALEVMESSPTKTDSEKHDHVDEDDVQVVERVDDLKKGSSGRKRKHKPQPPVRKYDVNEPAIIILDSFGMKHNETTRNLKEYLVLEAKSKLNRDIDRERINGMTAKYIPQQTNFCDCGLFLLGYMEKFFQGPQLLVHQLLQKTPMDELDWPRMNASNMRNDIRTILIRMGEEQEELRKAARREVAKQKGKYHEKRGEMKAKAGDGPPKTPLAITARSTPVALRGGAQGSSVKKAVEEVRTRQEKAPIPVGESASSNAVAVPEKDQKSLVNKGDAEVRARQEKTPEPSAAGQLQSTAKIIAPPSQQDSVVVLDDSLQKSEEVETNLAFTTPNRPERSVVREESPMPSLSESFEASPQMMAKAALGMCIGDSQESPEDRKPINTNHLTFRPSEFDEEETQTNVIVPMTAPEAPPKTPPHQSQASTFIAATP